MNLLETEGISKAFGGIQALQTCSVRVAEGEIAGLIGPNGSGKTTLFNVITGYERADAGAVRVRSSRGAMPGSGAGCSSCSSS
jgi:ABC-type branched-subunit amino acid transport system ATPase component